MRKILAGVVLLCGAASAWADAIEPTIVNWCSTDAQLTYLPPERWKLKVAGHKPVFLNYSDAVEVTLVTYEGAAERRDDRLTLLVRDRIFRPCP